MLISPISGKVLLFLYDCLHTHRWFDTGEDDGQIERTLYPVDMSGAPIPEEQNNSANIIVPLISPKTSREPTPVSELLGEPKKEPDVKEEPKIEEIEEAAKTPTLVPEPEGEYQSESFYNSLLM